MNSQVNASLQNQNLCTDLRREANQIHELARKFTQVVKHHKLYAYRGLAINLC